MKYLRFLLYMLVGFLALGGPCFLFLALVWNLNNTGNLQMPTQKEILLSVPISFYFGASFGLAYGCFSKLESPGISKKIKYFFRFSLYMLAGATVFGVACLLFVALFCHWARTGNAQLPTQKELHQAFLLSGYFGASCGLVCGYLRELKRATG